MLVGMCKGRVNRNTGASRSDHEQPQQSAAGQQEME